MIDFDKAQHCPKCQEPMQVLLPIWITPGTESVDTGEVQYDSSMAKDSNNWHCSNCGSHHFPIGLGGVPADATPAD